MAAILTSVCLEGLGRKSLPEIPSAAFYLLKDVVLLFGLVRFGMATRLASSLYRGYGVVLALAIVWTVLQLFNPAQLSFSVGLLGLRSYWLWWIAPLVIARALQKEEDRRRCVLILGLLSIGISLYASYQFSLPPGDEQNAYASYDGLVPQTALQPSTGRPRVSSTFSYISGFTDFVTIAPALLLSLGLGATDRTTRMVTFAAAILSAIALPMGGGRAPVLFALLAIVLVAAGVGFLGTRLGRRVLATTALATAGALLLAPEASQGVQDRFATDETHERLSAALQFIPPLAPFIVDYPSLGVGTGMLQNAAEMTGVEQRWVTEYEPGRYLIELGLIGYLLLIGARLGLAVGLFRAARILKKAGQGPAAGAALAFTAFALLGNLSFDHVWQALFFTGVGILLNAAMTANDALSPSSVRARTGPRK
jgi:hypothetical protein